MEFSWSASVYPLSAQIAHRCHTEYIWSTHILNTILTFYIIGLTWGKLPSLLGFVLILIFFFGCCLVNSCVGLRKGEPVQSWVHLGKSTMPSCGKGCQIGSSEQQVHLQPLCCIWSLGYTFGCVFLCPVCTYS